MADIRTRKPLRNFSRRLWLDTEATSIENGRILEIAFAITDGNDEVIYKYDAVINPFFPEKPNFDSLSTWCRVHHADSGLLEDVVKKGRSKREVEMEVLQILGQHAPLQNGMITVFGCNPQFDMNLLKQEMPSILQFLHHRTVNISSSLFLLQDALTVVRRQLKFDTTCKHRAMSDVEGALKMYKQQKEFLRSMYKTLTNGGTRA